MGDVKRVSNGITEGVIWKQILLFFFPILFGTLFMTLYNTVDAVIVGQILGKEALAAVSGGTSTLTNLIIGFFNGMASGATVVISQFYGAKDEDKVKKERELEKAINSIKKEFGKNSILKGINFVEGATTRKRNKLIGGHRSGEED